jgi:hypothetical protein
MVLPKGSVMELDELLAAAAPPTTRRTAELDFEIRRLVGEVESTFRPQRRTLRAGLIGVAAAATLGLGTATAMAAGVVPTPAWVPWTTASGSDCQMQFTARPLTDTTSVKRYTAAERRLVVDEANRFLASFNYASVVEQRAVAEFQAEENEAINGQPDPSERQPRLAGDDLTLTAVGFEVWDALENHLRSLGMDPALVGYGQGWKCGE